MNQKITLKITFVALLATMVSCQKKEAIKKDKLKTAEWLIGNWETKTPDGTLTESWQKVNDSTFSATSYFIKGKDTLHQERIVLSQKGENLTYSATVKGQNDGKTIDFPSTSETETKLVFENPQHDFPQKITYTKTANNTVTAQVTGKLQGKITTDTFVMASRR